MSEENVLPAVARNIHLSCKKCGTDRYHVVVAHTSDTSAKVKCEVCGAQKTYKLPKVQERKKSSTATRASTRPSKAKAKVDHAAVWSQLRDKIGVEKILPYNMRTKFLTETAIDHPKFGIGFITLATSDKIEVTFQEGGRSLVHNRG